MKDITSPKLLKLKGALFAILGCMSGALLLVPSFTWQNLLLLLITIWAFSRAYYFCFYVMQHYADPTFRYAGLWDLFRYLVRGRK